MRALPPPLVPLSLLPLAIVGLSWPDEAPAPEVLQARRLDIVDEMGVSVAHLSERDGKVELVIGGSAQISLVTERGTAAVNLLGEETFVRALGEQRAALLGPEEVCPLSTSEAWAP